MKIQVVAVTALAMAAAVSGASATETAPPPDGERPPLEFHFDGKPSTGYSWILNEGESRGLDITKLESLGYGAPYTSKLGSDAPFRFKLTCTGNGVARMLFDYVSPDGKDIASRQIYEVDCQ